MQPKVLFSIFVTFMNKPTTNNPNATPKFLSNKRFDDTQYLYTIPKIYKCNCK